MRGGRKFAAILALLALFARPGFADPAASEQEATSEHVAFVDMLEIHQDQWLALHLFAYNLARNQSDVDDWDRVSIEPIDMALVEGELRDEIAPLIEAYAPYAKMHPLFSDELAVLGGHIAERGIETLPDEKVRKALIEFMPHYAAHFAPRHGQAVADVAEQVRVHMEEHGELVAAELSRMLGAEWGSRPIRVDVVPYVTRAGAFTAGGYRWTVMSAMDTGYRDHAFEMVFHEATHMKPIGSNIQEIARTALQEHGIEGPRFWHYLLFYASGEATRKALGPDYVPYIYAQGPRHRFGAKPFYDAIEATWDEHDSLQDRANAAAAWLAARKENDE